MRSEFIRLENVFRDLHGIAKGGNLQWFPSALLAVLAVSYNARSTNYQSHQFDVENKTLGKVQFSL